MSNLLWKTLPFNYDLLSEARNKKKQKEHCRHNDCPKCHGTGKKDDGTQCIHMISCPCKKCKPHSL